MQTLERILKGRIILWIYTSDLDYEELGLKTEYHYSTNWWEISNLQKITNSITYSFLYFLNTKLIVAFY
jgi:hypothetical protein